ncbi:MAG: DUF6979 family protein [Terriglobia bacterium]
MGQYGNAAIRATELVSENPALSTQDAWDAAIKECSDCIESQKKVCPRKAYLGLCEAGVVRGIQSGGFAGKSANGEYAVRAYELLLSDPSLVKNKGLLWRSVNANAKHENGQMDVVISLWEHRLLEDS